MENLLCPPWHKVDQHLRVPTQDGQGDLEEDDAGLANCEGPPDCQALLPPLMPPLCQVLIAPGGQCAGCDDPEDICGESGDREDIADVPVEHVVAQTRLEPSKRNVEKEVAVDKDPPEVVEQLHQGDHRGEGAHGDELPSPGSLEFRHDATDLPETRVLLLLAPLMRPKSKSRLADKQKACFGVSGLQGLPKGLPLAAEHPINFR